MPCASLSKSLLAALALAAAAPACSRSASARDGERGPHGDALEAAQLAELETLGVGERPVAPPGVDPVIWAARVPNDNRPTRARIALGRKLYFDTRLSRDNTVACSTCHDVTRSFTDRRRTSEGIRNQTGMRNAPTTMNAALLDSQFWDGRAPTLEDQAKLPIINPIEMGMPSPAAAVAVVRADPEYRAMFQAAYGRPVSYEDIGRGIAAFERTLIFLDAPFDRFLAGDAGAISPAAQRGWILYNGKGRCTACHPLSPSNPLGSDGRFHNVGVSARHRAFQPLARRALVELEKNPSISSFEKLAVGTDLSELGRFLISKNYDDVGAFRTPQIRNAGVTAPYMHDGSMDTLWDVMDHYNKGGEANPYLDGGMETLALSEAEIDDMVTFLFSLTDDRFAELNRIEMSRQRALSRRKRPFRDADLAHRRRIPFDPRRPSQ